MRTLATDEIGKSYRGRRVVNGVSIRVGQGEVVGLLGPNGAGKTTTFYAIVGLIPPDTGRVLIDEEEITDVPMYSTGAPVRHKLPPSGSFGVPQAYG